MGVLRSDGVKFTEAVEVTALEADNDAAGNASGARDNGKRRCKMLAETSFNFEKKILDIIHFTWTQGVKKSTVTKIIKNGLDDFTPGFFFAAQGFGQFFQTLCCFDLKIRFFAFRFYFRSQKTGASKYHPSVDG